MGCRRRSYASATRSRLSRTLCIRSRCTLAPLGGEHRVHGVVAVTVLTNPVCLAQDSLLAKAQPLRYCAAANVLDVGADLDPVQFPLGERMSDERAHCVRHRAAPLLVLG